MYSFQLRVIANPSSPHRDLLIIEKKMSGLHIHPTEPVPEPVAEDSQSQKQLSCEVCFKIFNKKKELTRHQKTHMKPKKCRDCGEEFQSDIELDNHKKIHLKCEVCGKEYKEKKNLNKHKKVHTKFRQ